MYIIRSITIKTSFLLHKNLPDLILGGYIYWYAPPRRYGPDRRISEDSFYVKEVLDPMYQVILTPWRVGLYSFVVIVIIIIALVFFSDRRIVQ